MPYLKVGNENSGGIHLHYEDHGVGQPVILIHGWPLCGQMWEKQIPVLLRSNHRVITYDRRGFGNSDQPTWGYNFDVFAEDLSRIILALDLQDVILVGHSMGGGEVARYMGTYGTDRIDKAVFISAIPPFLLKSEDNPMGLEAQAFENIKSGLRADRPAFLRTMLSNFYNLDILKGRGASDEAVQMSWAIGLMASPTGTLECVDTWMADFRKDLTRVDVPTLVIHGNADRIVPAEVSGDRVPKYIKVCKVEVIDGGPHSAVWTHSEQVNRALMDFIGQGALAGRTRPITRTRLSEIHEGVKI